jgi:hypothetical protein
MPILLRIQLAHCALAGAPSCPVVVKVTDSGFHWGDAAVGAAATLAAGLLVLALVLLRSRTATGTAS